MTQKVGGRVACDRAIVLICLSDVIGASLGTAAWLNRSLSAEMHRRDSSQSCPSVLIPG